jgi:RNA polymerase sigma-70 factor (ECF subfamily)
MSRMDDVAATVVAPRASEPGVGGTGFASFFAQHHEALFRALWLLTRDPDEAEEVSQEAFLRLWERWDRVSAGPDPVAYLYRTAMNHWKSRLRRMAVAARKVVHQTWREDEIEGVESRDVVVRSLAALPPRQRAAVVLMDVLDLTSERAAAALGIRPVTVRVLAARARATLANEMGAIDA